MKLPFEKMCGVIRQPVAFGATADVPAISVSVFSQYAIPTYSQKFEDCVGHATANVIEMIIRRYVNPLAFKEGEQLNGELIWRKARQMFFPNEPVEGGGLMVDHGFHAARELGILPPDVVIGSYTMGLGALSRILQEVPVVQGTAVHDGWGHPDKENGQIPFDLPNPYAGHATALIGVLLKNGNPYPLFQNSWGKDWGFHGYGLLEGAQWQQSLLAPVSFIKPNLHGWDGWKAHIIRP